MKRFLLLSLLLIVCLGAKALHGYQAGDFWYQFETNNRAVITWNSGTTYPIETYQYPFSEINIPEQFNYTNSSGRTTTYTVVGIDSKAFMLCVNLTKVTMPNTLTWIGSYAFSECINLSNLTISSSCQSIYENAFDKCVSLIEMTVLNPTPPSCSYFPPNLTTVYVPYGAKPAYMAASGWKNYFIVELEGEASGSLNMKNFEIGISDTAKVPVNFEGDYAANSITSFTTEIELPNGITLQNAEPESSLKSAGFSCSLTSLSANRYKVTLTDTKGAGTQLTEGLFTLTFAADAKSTEGEQIITMTNQSLTTKSGNKVDLSESETTVTITSVAPTSVKINANGGSNLDPKETLQLSAVVSPANTTYPAVSWQSSDSSVADVDATGLVTARKPGTATITAYVTAYPAVKDTYSISVNTPLYGDSNDNGVVNVSDVITTAYHVIDLPTSSWSFIKADVNQDDAITPADITGTVDIILNEMQSANLRRMAAGSESTGVQLLINDVTLKQDEIRTSALSISLPSSEKLEYAGIQFDILLPEGISLSSVTTGPSLAQFNVRSREAADGKTRIVVYGNGANVSDELEEALYLTFQGSQTASPGDYRCLVNNVFLSDPLGHDIFGSDSEFYIHLLADNTSGSSQNPDVNNPDSEPNPSEIPTVSDDRNSEGWYGNFNGTYISEYRIREGNTLGMMVETPDGGYNDEWDFLWKDSEGNVLGEEQVIYTPALLFSGDYNEDYQIRRVRDYNVTLTSYGPDDNIWAKTTLYTTPVYIYKRPALPRQLLRKGDGTSCTFVVMMNGLSDEELARLGYSFVYGYYDFEGKAQILDTTALRYTHTTSEIYNNPSNRFWVYSQWPYADGSIVSSGLLFLDGTTDDIFDASIFGNGPQNIIRDIDDKSIYSLDGRYLGTDESNLEPGIYICNGKKFIKR